MCGRPNDSEPTKETGYLQYFSVFIMALQYLHCEKLTKEIL